MPCQVCFILSLNTSVDLFEQDYGNNRTQNCSVIHSSLYAIASHSAVYLWDGMNTLNKLSDCGSTVWDLDVSCDGQLLMAGSADGIIRSSSVHCVILRIWRTSSFSEPLTLTTNQNDLYSIAAHPVVPQFILSGGFNGTVELWNSETSRILKVETRREFDLAILTTFQFCFCTYR